MNTQNLFPKTAVLAIVLVSLFMIWPQDPSININPGPSEAIASVGVATESAETLFTASTDGKTIYMWQYFSSKPPKFIGQADAILTEGNSK